MTKKIWLVEFPTHKYKEDVKELARQNNLRVIDDRYKNLCSPDEIESKVPTLTLKGAKPKPKATLTEKTD